MRSSRNMRLMSTDLKRLQKSVKEKTEKEAEGLLQLIDLPDFDVSQFFQTLMRNPNHNQILNKIPTQKQIQFFSRNFVSFIETQQQLAQLKLPELQEIPKSKQFKVDDPECTKETEGEDEESVLDIIQTFGAAVLQKNTSEVVRILQMIKQMKQSERFQPYFKKFSISQLYRESYETFLENCEDIPILLSMEEYSVALQKFLKEKGDNFIHGIRVDTTFYRTADGIRKIMQRLNSFIESTIQECRQEFGSEKMSIMTEADIRIPKFVMDFSKQFYQTIEPVIYEKEELSEILASLQTIIQCSTQLESKGINLSRDFRQLICHDMPIHMNKILQVVIEAFDDLLKDDNDVYQFKFFDSLATLGQEIDRLTPLEEGDFSKKCCSKKGILLINSFAIILEPLCDDKWAFLQENVLKQLLNQVTGAIEANWNFWDYYQLFFFFDKMKRGKVNHKRMFNEDDIPVNLQDKLSMIGKLSMQCWEYFESNLTNKLWGTILSKIPISMWEIRDYMETKGEPQQKPTLFSMELVFNFQKFLNTFQQQIQRQQFQYLLQRFYEYVLYVIEYVLYDEYHKKGTKENVFSLSKKADRAFKRAKTFALEDLNFVKERKRMLTIGRFTKSGIKNFALDLYFFSDAVKVMGEYSKINVDSFVQKISQIEAKEHKTDPVNVARQNFAKDVDACIKVFKEEPEKIRLYMEKKRKQLNKKQSSG